MHPTAGAPASCLGDRCRKGEASRRRGAGPPLPPAGRARRSELADDGKKCGLHGPDRPQRQAALRRDLPRRARAAPLRRHLRHQREADRAWAAAESDALLSRTCRLAAPTARSRCSGRRRTRSRSTRSCLHRPRNPAWRRASASVAAGVSGSVGHRCPPGSGRHDPDRLHPRARAIPACLTSLGSTRPSRPC